MGVIVIVKVITGTDRARTPQTTQLGNCKWVTVIKAIYMQGFAILTFIIFKAIIHQASWYKEGLLPPDWAIGVNKNG